MRGGRHGQLADVGHRGRGRAHLGAGHALGGLRRGAFQATSHPRPGQRCRPRVHRVRRRALRAAQARVRLSMLGTMGDPYAQPGPDRRYMDTMPLGACDPGERLQLLDKQGLDAAVLYTTLGIIWEIATRDVELADAMSRAYNRWIADFCRDSGGRLVGIAHLSLMDPHAGGQGARAGGRRRLPGSDLSALELEQGPPWRPVLRSAVGDGAGPRRARHHPSGLSSPTSPTPLVATPITTARRASGGRGAVVHEQHGGAHRRAGMLHVVLRLRHPRPLSPASGWACSNPAPVGWDRCSTGWNPLQGETILKHTLGHDPAGQ